ncbi:hypothetical protein FHT79_006461 [Rhizobium sp. BK212]|uniref:hypothetical protein n=1 Tax=Rhizobium sp. BK212 TaxID=2587074 RepID=UPI0016109353|nr:hypothetical protein [Rhizobium sp. BK212]MBB4219230.1 hypothetical protein [Rhizobium sp. BK212]
MLTHASSPTIAAENEISSFAEFERSSLPEDILWKVLARNGKSKTYTQVLPLDGGTVGIANFARGGLAGLYRLMDTQEYFGRSEDDMVDNYSSNCRPGTRRGNDTGWGCYSQKWWREGMIRFVNSPGSHDLQKRAWINEMKPTVELSLEHGWRSNRDLAIATGIANSLGSHTFRKIAAGHGWRPEKVLSAYVGNNEHRKRRRDAINAAFPR